MRPNANSAAVLLALSMLAVLLLMPALPAGARTPELQISLASSELKLDGSTGQPLVGRFDGMVSVMGNDFQSAEVTLTVEAGNWGQSVTPDEKVVTGNESFSFSVVLTPPSDAPEGTSLVRVIAKAVSPASEPALAQDSISVWIVRNRVRIECAQPVRTAQAGATVNFALKVYNDGSTGDTFLSSLQPRPESIRDRLSYLLDHDSVDVEAGSFVYLNVLVQVPANLTPRTYEAFFTVQSSGSNSSAGVTLSVVIPEQPFPEPQGQAGPNYMLLLGVSALIIGVCMTVFIGGTEIGLLAFLQFILVPLFVRIRKERVLDHFTRGQIFGFIKANPGTHYIAIQEHMELQNGVLAYHLKVLEREDYITSERDGIYKRFYPRHMKIPKKERQLSRVQLDIISALRTHPGTSQNGLARMLGESKQVIGYHIRVLEKAGIARVERDAQATRCFLAGDDTGRAAEAEQPSQVEEEPPAQATPEIIKEIRA